MDSLGGSGSRGYGRIEFQFDDKVLNEKFRNKKPFTNGGNLQ
jgi:CRISPR-associated protein Csm3